MATYTHNASEVLRSSNATRLQMRTAMYVANRRTADLSSNDYTTVEWLSMKSGGDKDVLTIGGTSETGEKYGIIKSASMSTVANAQWFEIDSRTFDKAELTSVPSGVGTWYEVRLTKR